MPKYYYHSYLFEFKYVYIVLKGIVFRINKENGLQFNFNLYLWLYHNFRHYRNVDTTHQCFFDCQQIGLLVCCTPHFQIIANFDNNSIIASAWTHTFILLNGSNYQNMTQEEGIYYFFFSILLCFICFGFGFGTFTLVCRIYKRELVALHQTKTYIARTRLSTSQNCLLNTVAVLIQHFFSLTLIHVH